MSKFWECDNCNSVLLFLEDDSGVVEYHDMQFDDPEIFTFCPVCNEQRRFHLCDEWVQRELGAIAKAYIKQ